MIFHDVIRLISPRERKRWVLLVVLMCGAAVMDVIGVTSVMPFLAVLANPDTIQSNPFVQWIYELGAFESTDSFLFALGIGSFTMLVLSAVVRSVTLYAQNLFTGMQRHSLSCRLLEGYLAQPYEFFLNRHSGEMGRNILSEVDQFVERALIPIAGLFSSAFILAAMVLVLIVVDPMSALIVAIVLGATYWLIFAIVRPLLTRLGEERLEANRVRFETASEALTGIKTVKLLGREENYARRFRYPSQIFARNIALSGVIAMVPKFVVETIAFGGILALALVLMIRNGGASGGGLATVLPLLGLYALAGYRMLPAVQSMYQAIAQLRFARPVIETMRRELGAAKGRQVSGAFVTEPLTFARDLTLDAVTYHYPNSQGVGIADISLCIPRGASIGIVGATGAGKTTLVDVLLGLLDPTSGHLTVDGVAVTEANRAAWQLNLGYVPQDIFLTDSSVAENIAFGLSRDEIDMARVESSARMARIHDFITGQLPQGYATRVGERGVRLSGGQRQRIGIARALYRDPEVIVFDEATSALDNLTEAEVMDAIAALSRRKTVIMIAHRLTTVQRCDRILVLDQGKIAGFGGYAELAASNSHLKRMLEPASAPASIVSGQ